MKITLLAGDGIGPEIMQAAINVLDAAAKKFNFNVEYDEELLGGAAIDATGVPFPEKTERAAKAADAVLLAAVGGPKWDNVAPAVRPKKVCLPSEKLWDCIAICAP
jgi:3-isopropylmalate dehydrogenase